MLATSQSKLLSASYPGLKSLPPNFAAKLESEGQAFRARNGAVLFEEDRFCTAYPLIVAGTARVVKSGMAGREIGLYRVRPGEYCLLSAIGILARRQYPARAVAEGATTGVVIPVDLFRSLMRSTDRFSADVFNGIGRRVDVLVDLIEQISVLHIDQRLAALLLARGGEIRATHQELADEIGCARENLSRALGSFRRRGLVRLGRGHIAVLDPAALISIAAMKEPGVGGPRPANSGLARSRVPG